VNERPTQPASSRPAPSSLVAWLRLARHPATVRRATLTALVVGAILIAINHGDEIVRGEMTRTRWLKVLLTLIVPYLVSTASSVSTRKELLP
jgi:hypothetical protein